MGMTMMALGDFRFALDTAAYDKFALTQSWRWPKQDRIGRDPALQFVGLDAAEIELDGVIYPTFRGGLDQIEKLRAMADEGKSLMLTDGIGRVWGKWVIERIQDTRSVLIDNGEARRIEFRMTLKAYGENETPARWSPLSRQKPTSAVAPIAAAGGSSTLDDLAETVEGWPDIDYGWPQDEIADFGEQALSALGTLDQALGTVAQAASQALASAQTILGQSGIAPAMRPLVDAFGSAVVSAVGGGLPMLPDLDWPGRVLGQARDLTRRADPLAITGQALIDRVVEIATPGLAPVDPLFVAARPALDTAKQVAEIAREIERKWSVA